MSKLPSFSTVSESRLPSGERRGLAYAPGSSISLRGPPWRSTETIRVLGHLGSAAQVSQHAGRRERELRRAFRRVPEDVLHDRRRRAGDLEPRQVERHGKQRRLADVHQVTRGRRTGRRSHPSAGPCARRSPGQHLDRRVVEVRGRLGVGREDHGLAAGQHLRPAVRGLLLRLVERGDRLGVAAGRRDTEQAAGGVGREDDRAVLAPSSRRGSA